MTETEVKLAKIRVLLDALQNDLQEIREILRGEPTREEKTCSSCEFWTGSCQLGKIGKIANSEACERWKKQTHQFKPLTLA